MLDEKQKILDKNSFLNNRKNARILTKYEKSKRNYLILSIFLCLIIIALIYLLSSKSNIYQISIDGNVYLKDEDIRQLSGLSTNSKYLFTMPNNIQAKIKENALIDECTVEMLDNNLVKISVKEKKIIGYTYEDNNNVLILADDSRIVLDKSNIYLINKVPLIEGFNKDKLILIEKNFEELDYRMINEISEIHYYPSLKFQDHELIMRDGNYVFTSVYGLNLLNKYHNMASSFISNQNNCYYIEDISGNAYTSACPWEPKAEENIEDVNKEEDIEEE